MTSHSHRTTRTKLDPRASGLRPRIVMPATPVSEVSTRVSGVDTLLELGDLLQRDSSLAAIFPLLAACMRRMSPFSAIGIAVHTPEIPPLVSCTDEEERGRVSAIVDAAGGYFGGRSTLDRFDTLAAGERWICIPIVVERSQPFGVLAVAFERDTVEIDESVISFVSCVARQLGHALAPNAALEQEREARAAAESKERSAAIASELAELVLTSFDSRHALRELSRVVGSRLADGCIIDIEGNTRMTHARLQTEPALAAVLDPLTATVIATGRTASAGTSAPTGAAADRARRILGVDWLVCAPISSPTDEGPLGTLTVFGSVVRHQPLAPIFLLELASRIGIGVHNARMYEAALTAVRQREAVLSTVSHDLKNPLGVILLSAAHMLDAAAPHGSDATRRAQIEMIRRNAERMTHLVADLLDFSAMEAGVMSSRPALCDPRKLLSEAVDDAREAAAAARIELVLDARRPLPLVSIDRDRTIQVLANLIGNAIKFTPHGGSIVVRGARGSDGDVIAEVIDSGKGISAENLPRVFDRFWQADPAARRGSGLGLAICKAIVELSGGRIWAESRLGHGALFAFSMPTSRTREDVRGAIG